MKEISPPKFLILTFLALFLFTFAAGAMFFWPQARSSSEAAKNEQVGSK